MSVNLKNFSVEVPQFGINSHNWLYKILPWKADFVLITITKPLKIILLRACLIPVTKIKMGLLVTQRSINAGKVISIILSQVVNLF